MCGRAEYKFLSANKTVYRPRAAGEIVSNGSVLVSKNIAMHSENFFLRQ
jgi:hypothetical protein